MESELIMRSNSKSIKLNRSLGFVVGLAITAMAVPASAQLSELHDAREKHLANVTQLTFGGDNAEAYWSFDGKKIIFQSRPDQNSADQIYTMNADGTGKKLVSTGK